MTKDQFKVTKMESTRIQPSVEKFTSRLTVMEQHQFKVELIASTMLTPSVVELTFARTDNQVFRFIPGQFITFLLPHASGKTVPRSYSLASSPDESNKFAIAIAPVEGGFATQIFFNLKIGDTLHCVGPKGRFILHEADKPAQYILVATGTGVAPYHAMLPTIAKRLEADNKLKATLLLGVRYTHDLLYADDFISFAKTYKRFQFISYLSRADPLTTSYASTGYVQSAFKELDLNPLTDLIYLCGNPYMIDDSIEQLEKIGFHQQNIRREKYISRRV